MAVNKNAQLRYNVIDKCLSNFQRKHTYYTILEEVNEALEYNNCDGIKLRQLQEDINFMESDAGFGIVLAQDIKDGKKRVLRYEDKKFSISEHPLNQLDSEQLADTLTILSRYKNRTEFSWLNEFIPRMEQAFDLVGQGENSIISYQENPDLKGAHWIGVLFNLIAKKKTASIVYEAFGKEEQNYLIHPYHLKQYNSRWFLFCKTDPYDSVSNYPLDRISYVEEANHPFTENKTNWQDYFDDIIGVTMPVDVKSEKIILRFSERRINYVLTKPIHGVTQKLVKTDPTGQTIEIDVIPNPELYQTLLSFGPDLEVISPIKIRDEIKIRITEMQTKYNSVE